jgi:hypothetical protein
MQNSEICRPKSFDVSHDADRRERSASQRHVLYHRRDAPRYVITQDRWTCEQRSFSTIILRVVMAQVVGWPAAPS